MQAYADLFECYLPDMNYIPQCDYTMTSIYDLLVKSYGLDVSKAEFFNDGKFKRLVDAKAQTFRTSQHQIHGELPGYAKRGIGGGKYASGCVCEPRQTAEGTIDDPAAATARH